MNGRLKCKSVLDCNDFLNKERMNPVYLVTCTFHSNKKAESEEVHKSSI